MQDWGNIRANGTNLTSLFDKLEDIIHICAKSYAACDREAPMVGLDIDAEFPFSPSEKEEYEVMTSRLW